MFKWTKLLRIIIEKGRYPTDLKDESYLRTSKNLTIKKARKCISVRVSDSGRVAGWRHFTFTTRNLFVFQFMFKSGNPSDV